MVEDDPLLLAKIMRRVKLEVIQPMRIKIGRWSEGKETDSHIFEVPLGRSLQDLQQDIARIASRWKGGFPIGTRYTVERVE